MFSLLKRVPNDSEKMLTVYSLIMMVFLYFRKKNLENYCLVLILWHKYKKVDRPDSGLNYVAINWSQLPWAH